MLESLYQMPNFLPDPVNATGTFFSEVRVVDVKIRQCHFPVTLDGLSRS